MQLEVTAVVLGGPVAVPPKVMLPAGHPEAVVPPVVLHVKVMVRGKEFPPGLGHRVIRVDFGRVGGVVLQVGEDGVGGELGHGLGPPLVQHLLPFAGGQSICKCFVRRRGGWADPTGFLVPRGVTLSIFISI